MFSPNYSNLEKFGQSKLTFAFYVLATSFCLVLDDYRFSLNCDIGLTIGGSKLRIGPMILDGREKRTSTFLCLVLVL